MTKLYSIFKLHFYKGSHLQKCVVFAAAGFEKKKKRVPKCANAKGTLLPQHCMCVWLMCDCDLRAAAAGSSVTTALWRHRVKAGPSCTPAASPITTKACPPQLVSDTLQCRLWIPELPHIIRTDAHTQHISDALD